MFCPPKRAKADLYPWTKCIKIPVKPCSYVQYVSVVVAPVYFQPLVGTLLLFYLLFNTVFGFMEGLCMLKYIVCYLPAADQFVKT